MNRSICNCNVVTIRCKVLKSKISREIETIIIVQKCLCFFLLIKTLIWRR